jgi:hypothetical protein
MSGEQKSPTKTNTTTTTTSSKKRLQLMHSFARIKPSSADLKGGLSAKQSITSWDEEGGEVTLSSTSSSNKLTTTTFEHFHRTIPPDSTQSKCYNDICSPLILQWLDGYDVDIICYGQTGSGKTYTQFGPPKSMKRVLETLGDDGGKDTISSEGVLTEDHGFILRAGFDALKKVNEINNTNGCHAVLHGSMVEMSILSAKSQNAGDLLNKKKPCFVDIEHHLEGAVHIPLIDGRSLIQLAAAVETRLTRGTKMNQSSSRSHCVTVFTLHVLDSNDHVRISRLNFFDFMGSERFSGSNAAHNTNQSARSTMAGWEGIFANYSLLFLGEAVRAASNARRKKRGTIQKMGGQGFLNELLAGSLIGHAITGMITCLSPSERNGDESLLSCKYSKDMSKMQNEPKKQPNVHIDDILNTKKAHLKKSLSIVKRGVAGKYQAKRKAEVVGYENSIQILMELKSCSSGNSGDVDVSDTKGKRK